jgi:hypothetical protein
MAKVQFVTQENAARIEAPPCGRGQIQSRAYFKEATDPLHLQVHQLTADAVLNVSSLATDTLVYVWTGAVVVQGVRLGERSSLIMERGASTELSAVDGVATLLFFTPKERSGEVVPHDGAAPHLRLLPSERVPRNADLGGQGLAGGALHADASDISRHLWLHENDFHVGDTPVAVHSHSEDEIIFVRDGELRVGNRHYGPGAALAVAAHTKYGFQVGPNGLSFVNFRASAPTYTSDDGKHSMDEAEFWRSQTGRPEYMDFPTG